MAGNVSILSECPVTCTAQTVRASLNSPPLHRCVLPGGVAVAAWNNTRRVVSPELLQLLLRDASRQFRHDNASQVMQICFFIIDARHGCTDDTRTACDQAAEQVGTWLPPGGTCFVGAPNTYLSI